MVAFLWDFSTGLEMPSTTILITSAAVAIAIVMLAKFLFSTKPSPIPVATSRILENIKGLSGPESPMWILGVGRKLNSWNFIIPLLPGLDSVHVIGEHSLMREILQDKTSDKPRDVYKSFEGTGAKTMFTSSNDHYMRCMRKATALAFSRNEVQRMNDIATKYVQAWLHGRLQEFIEKDEAWDPAREFNRITFFVICEAAFEYMATNEEFEMFEHHSEITTREFVGKAPFNPFRKYLSWLLPERRTALKSQEIIFDFAGKVLDTYLQKPMEERSKSNTLIKILSDDEVTKSVIASERQRNAEIKDWLTAGHDTTGYTLGNLTTLLAKTPRVQSKLRKELQEISAKGGSAQESPYFRQVLREAMRVMPVAAGGSGRVTGRDYTTNEGKILPKGSVCFMNQYLLNHNPDVFGKDSVNDFDPERWDDDRVTEVMKVAMAPFALGSRSCPGQSLAMAETYNTLPRLLVNYELELVDEGKKKYFLTLKYIGSKVKARKIPKS